MLNIFKDILMFSGDFIQLKCRESAFNIVYTVHIHLYKEIC